MASPVQESKLSSSIEQRATDAIRMLSIDGVEKANSGHPGAPLGCADIAYVLWSKFLRFNPEDPEWTDRDRFVLSNGHASMLIYSLLHLFGYDLPLEELKKFRQLGSRTPGHPEYRLTPGVETTTGPLGQGFANGVGMALGAKMLAARFPGDETFSPVSHRIFGIVSDGDLMEGVASEAASLAGHLALDNLVYVFDDNHITIDGNTELTFTENVAERFAAYGWWTKEVDGHDRDALEAAVREALQVTGKPHLILAKTIIGRGAPTKADREVVHGAPLGEKELEGTKDFYGWPHEPTFLIPDDVKEHYASLCEEKKKAYAAWKSDLDAWRGRASAQASALDAHLARTLPDDFDRQILDAVGNDDKATRKHSGAALQKAAELVPALVGGSADLAGSNNSLIKDGGDVQPGHYQGRNLYFGVREHGMASIVNGLTLHQGFRGYGATFLIFSDYCRPAVRLSALMNIPSVWVFTHDSIFLGEDGPTHQPVEHLSSLRAIPRLEVWRPADGPETAMAWAWILQKTEGPAMLSLTRQTLPALQRPAAFGPRDVWKGGYVVRDTDGTPDAVVIATGSEVAVAVEAAAQLEKKGRHLRVVSMPCTERFDAQPEDYRHSVLPKGIRVAAVEAGAPMSWYRYAGTDGLVIGVETFGESAPWKDLARHFGLTAEAIAQRLESWLNA